ncbi:hypothetical protein Agub_g10023, partial [Astrephomene gubernaculifera]
MHGLSQSSSPSDSPDRTNCTTSNRHTSRDGGNGSGLNRTSVGCGAASSAPQAQTRQLAFPELIAKSLGSGGCDAAGSGYDMAPPPPAAAAQSHSPAAPAAAAGDVSGAVQRGLSGVGSGGLRTWPGGLVDVATT